MGAVMSVLNGFGSYLQACKGKYGGSSVQKTAADIQKVLSRFLSLLDSTNLE
jgi:hypothetical protein